MTNTLYYCDNLDILKRYVKDESVDLVCLDIRAKTRLKIRRTEVIRAQVASVEASGIDLTAYGTEDAIAAVIKKRLS